MEEGQLLDPGLLRERESLLVGRMTEPGVRLVLLAAVLGIVDQQVGVLAPARQVLQRSVRVVGEHRDFVVGRKGKAGRALIDPVPESRDRMHEEMRRDAQAGHLESLPRVSLDELHLSRHVVEPHRKVRGVHLVRERRLQGLRGAGRTDDRQMRSWHKCGREERESLDVVEVGVRDEQVRLQRLRLRERVA